MFNIFLMTFLIFVAIVFVAHGIFLLHGKGIRGIYTKKRLAIMEQCYNLPAVVRFNSIALIAAGAISAVCAFFVIVGFVWQGYFVAVPSIVMAAGLMIWSGYGGFFKK
ncbi:MAG: hypothetical protein FWB98_07345 [Defluviitaleaceae bacterium]|nr:hypothetical protein [Defluviitaleaceae bacterium]